MSQSIYIKLANLLIKLDERRNEKRAKVLNIENYAHLSEHTLKDIGLVEMASQRRLAQYSSSRPLEPFSRSNYLARHEHFR
ncbi:hypothetical protein [Motilimonas eburnea]|uniref:hypothetical protein n=1 Tax=Motilimonas eburnea TaxID=1737488 RepID=UPI001E41C5A3|nr:hypothetical protein [Motilimonas eburnea]MCE2570865.1 hypothetical protein [Motilimonas eburnea]